MTTHQKLLPWYTLGFALIMLVGLYRSDPRNKSEFDLDTFGALPVSAEGRVKPLDTVARNSLMVISDRQTLIADGKRLPAIQWLADTITAKISDDSDEAVMDYQVFRIDHPEVLSLVGVNTEGRTIESNELVSDDKKRHSLRTLLPYWDKILAEARKASEIDSAKRSTFQVQVHDLFQQLSTFVALNQLRSPYVVAPIAPNEEWRPISDPSFRERSEPHEAAKAFAEILSAYEERDAEKFNRKVSDYSNMLAGYIPSESNKAGFEVFFSRLAPFYLATALYVLAFILAFVSFLQSCSDSKSNWAEPVHRSTKWLMWFTLAIHTFGLVARIYLQGRPPVTNLYSSAIFIGWGVVLMAVVFERYYRLSLSTVVASLVGFLSLIVAHNLGGDGDTMEMMQAVLDSNFWLATHVIAITLGYSATFMAGFFAIVFVVLGVFSPLLRSTKSPLVKTIGKQVYGIVCFATLFSFVGTVLGGIWADQSWGRFWGWDPKENGAVLIVLINLIILHARWGGMIQERGIMVLAIFGNIITSWSWFGTNMLGVGLHSYGFMDSALFWLLVFVVSQMMVIAIGVLPFRFWMSFAHEYMDKAKPVASTTEPSPTS